MAARWWSEQEDGRRGALPVIEEIHVGTADELVRWSCRVRLPWQHQPRVRLVIRARPPYTPDAPMTVALEALRTDR